MEYQFSDDMFPTLRYQLTSLHTQPAASGSGGKGPSGTHCADPDVGGEGHRDAASNATPGAQEGSDLSEGCSVSQQLGPAVLRMLGIGPRPRPASPRPLTCAVLLRAEASLPGKEGQRPWGVPGPGDASLS